MKVAPEQIVTGRFGHEGLLLLKKPIYIQYNHRSLFLLLILLQKHAQDRFSFINNVAMCPYNIMKGLVACCVRVRVT